MCVMPELHDLIFLHFSARDFREVTKVSPSWNETLEESRVMMKNVTLKLDSLDQLISFEKVCTRRYRSLLVGFMRDAWRCQIPCETLEFFVSLSSSLCELEINCFYKLSSANEKLFDRIELSRLKVLKLNFVTEKLVDKLLSRCYSLTELKLDRIVERKYITEENLKPSIPSWPSFLERNQRLEDLEFSGNALYNALFEEDVSEMARFKLKHLRVDNYFKDLTMLPERYERNFLKFLGKQSSSLESLNIYFCRSNILEHAFNGMPALTSLKIIKCFGQENLSLRLNEKLLDLKVLCIDYLEGFERICRSVPNLTTFRTFRITSDIIKIIASNLPHLRTLVFLKCEVTDSRPTFRSLWPHATARRILVGHGFYAWSIEKQDTMQPNFDENDIFL